MSALNSAVETNMIHGEILKTLRRTYAPFPVERLRIMFNQRGEKFKIELINEVLEAYEYVKSLHPSDISKADLDTLKNDYQFDKILESLVQPVHAGILKKGCTKSVIKANIRTELKYGKKLEQAIAIALNMAEKCKKTNKKVVKKGAGLWDVIKDPIGTLKEGMEPIPTKLNNISTKTLSKYGQEPIQTIQIIRSPLSGFWTGALNTLSFGAFNEIKEKNGYDSLYHLSLLFGMEDETIIIEKNEVVNVSPIKDSDVGDKTEFYSISVPEDTNLDTIIDNTLKYMGANNFYEYDALGGNNCQNFIMNILIANNLLTPDAKEFLFQDMTGITNDLESSKRAHHLPELVKKITDVASKVSRLLGKGRRKNLENIDIDVIKFIENDGFKML